jgi:hypothetical protein
MAAIRSHHDLAKPGRRSLQPCLSTLLPGTLESGNTLLGSRCRHRYGSSGRSPNMRFQILRRGRPRNGEGRIAELMRNGLSHSEAASESLRLYRAMYLRRRREREPGFRIRERRAVLASYYRNKPAPHVTPKAIHCFNCGRRPGGNVFQEIERNVLVTGEIVAQKVLWCGRC